MENDEIPYLKNEIIRLNKIITVLLNQNDISMLKYPISKMQLGVGRLFNPMIKITQGR